jgi:hypothetical protein
LRQLCFRLWSRARTSPQPLFRSLCRTQFNRGSIARCARHSAVGGEGVRVSGCRADQLACRSICRSMRASFSSTCAAFSVRILAFRPAPVDTGTVQRDSSDLPFLCTQVPLARPSCGMQCVPYHSPRAFSCGGCTVECSQTFLSASQGMMMTRNIDLITTCFRWVCVHR